jgi:hypothetical protein
MRRADVKILVRKAKQTEEACFRTASGGAGAGNELLMDRWEAT